MLQAPSQLEELLDVFEVARILGVHKDTVYRWTRRGILPAVHLTSRWHRWSPKDIAEFIKQRTSGRF